MAELEEVKPQKSQPDEADKSTFSDCMCKAKELLEASAREAGKCVGANGQVVDAEEWEQCHKGTSVRKQQMESQLAVHRASSQPRDDVSASAENPADRTSSSSSLSSAQPFRTSSLFGASKFAARFRQKVFKKCECVIVSGTDESSYRPVTEGKQLMRKAKKIVESINQAKQKQERDSQAAGICIVEDDDKVYFEDTPWCSSFDPQYFYGGGHKVDIGLEVSAQPTAGAGMQRQRSN